MQVQLREYHKSDFNELEGIIRQTWHYDEFASPKIATKLARVFLTKLLNKLYVFSSCGYEWKSCWDYSG